MDKNRSKFFDALFRKMQQNSSHKKLGEWTIVNQIFDELCSKIWMSTYERKSENKRELNISKNRNSTPKKFIFK